MEIVIEKRSLRKLIKSWIILLNILKGITEI